MKSMIEPPTQAGGPATAAAAPTQKKRFDIDILKQYFHIVVRRIWLVALCFVISLAITVVNLVKQVPVYRSSTSLLLSQGLPLPDPVRYREVKIIGEIAETEARVINSSMVATRARERVGRPATEINQKLMRVYVWPIVKTAIIVIYCEALDPQFAADFANATAEAYLDFKAEERMETSQSTVVSLTQQANRLREELKREEARLEAFKRDNSVIALQQRGNVAASILASLSAEASSYRLERMLLEAKQPLIKDVSDEVVLQTLAAPLTPITRLVQPPIAMLSGADRERVRSASPQVEDEQGPEVLLERGVVPQTSWAGLKRQRTLLEYRLADLREKFRDAHPEVQAVLRELDENRRAMEIEVQFALQQFNAELDALKVKEQAALRVQREWEAEALEMSRKADEFNNLQKDIGRLQGLYELIFNRLKEIDISIGIEPETIRQLERAVPSYAPITPRKMQSIFIAALLGLGIGLGLVFLLEFIDDSFRFPEEVTREMGLPFFGVIPAANWDPDDLRSHMLSNIDQKSRLVEAYRNVRSSLLFSAPQDRVRSIVVTSAVPREGKTTTSLNIAVSLSQAGSRVLLVDGDLRRGELHKFFGLEGGRGLADVLAGQAKPDSVIQRTGVPNLDMVATGAFPPNPSELIMRSEFNTFMEYVRRNYDRIIFDCPPVMAVSEASIIASQVDGAVMVIWAGNTSRKLCLLAAQILRQRGANILGCILNNLEFGRVGYYYYSTYYGYYDYDYGYDRAERTKR